MVKELKKAPFLSRFFAFVIDMVLVALIAGIIATPFIDAKTIEKINKEEIELVTKYRTSEITPEAYVKGYGDVYYELVKTNGVSTFIGIILSIVYFVVFQLYNKGQTLGKKILKIRVVSEKEELTMNQMIFRSLLSNFILVNLISFAFLTFASKYVYIVGVATIEIINYILVFVSVIMATTKEGRTIHDRIAHTRVVKVK